MSRFVLETRSAGRETRIGAVCEVDAGLAVHGHWAAGHGQKAPTLILIERGPELVMMDPGGAPVRASALPNAVADLVERFRAGRRSD